MRFFTYKSFKFQMFSVPLFFLLFSFIGCNDNIKNNTEVKVIDLDVKTDRKNIETESKKDKLFVAISTMISPKETFVYYQELIKYISDKIKMPVEYKQRKTYKEVNQLLANNNVDFAFICSGAYVDESENGTIEILVVPVTRGKPTYNSYIIVNSKSNIKSFADLKGKTFAYSDPLSNSGYFYALKRIKEMHGSKDDYFSKTLFTYAHDYSIQLVSKKSVDGAAVDGLIYEYLAKFNPEKIKNIIVIEKSEDFAIPPVVVPKKLNYKIKEKLKNIFLNMDKDPQGQKILSKLLIDKFAVANDKDYDSVRKIQKLAHNK